MLLLSATKHDSSPQFSANYYPVRFLHSKYEPHDWPVLWVVFDRRVVGCRAKSESRGTMFHTSCCYDYRHLPCGRYRPGRQGEAALPPPPSPCTGSSLQPKAQTIQQMQRNTERKKQDASKGRTSVNNLCVSRGLGQRKRKGFTLRFTFAEHRVFCLITSCSPHHKQECLQQ